MTPPSSPSRVKKRKRPSLGASTESSKSGENSPEAESASTRNTDQEETQSAKDALAEKTHTDSAVEQIDKATQEKLTKDSAENMKTVSRSSSIQSLEDKSSLKDCDLSSKDKADKLAMPPPMSTTIISKTSRSGRRSSTSKAVDELKQRKRSSSRTPPPTNDIPTSVDLKSASGSIATSENTQMDAKGSSPPRSRASSFRERRSNSLTLSPRTSRKVSAPVIKVETKQVGRTVKKGNDKPSPRRRHRDRNENNETNISNNNSTTGHSEGSQIAPVDKTHSPSSRGQRRSSETSDPVTRSSPKRSHLGADGMEAEGRTSETEKGTPPQGQCMSPRIRGMCEIIIGDTIVLLSFK